MRAVRLQAGKSYLERAVQQLYRLELQCDDPPVQNPAVTLNVGATEFRSKREAAKKANSLIKNIATNELENYGLCGFLYLISSNQIGGVCGRL